MAMPCSRIIRLANPLASGQLASSADRSGLEAHATLHAELTRAGTAGALGAAGVVGRVDQEQHRRDRREAAADREADDRAGPQRSADIHLIAQVVAIWLGHVLGRALALEL